MPEKFHGIFPALVTPMTADEEVDYNTLAGFVDYLITEGGVQGLIPLGSTGEFYALSADERSEVLKTTIQTAAGRVPVVAGANAGSTRDVVRYCRQAEELGAAGVLLGAPYYSLPRNEELLEHFHAVNDAIGIPIMLYNYPGRTGVDMTPDLVQRLAELPRVQYIKESSGDITRTSEIIRCLGDRITVFCGCDTIALESFLLGACRLGKRHRKCIAPAARRVIPACRGETRLFGRKDFILQINAVIIAGRKRRKIHAICQSWMRFDRTPRRTATAPPAAHRREGISRFEKNIANLKLLPVRQFFFSCLNH